MASREETQVAEIVFVSGDTIEVEFWGLIIQIRPVITSFTQTITGMISCPNTDSSVM